MPQTEVKRIYLKMTAADELKPAKIESDRLQIHQAIECPASFYRYLYTEVGRKYHWCDRLNWTDEEIRNCIMNRKPSRAYLFPIYVCTDWAKEAATDCGLTCK